MSSPGDTLNRSFDSGGKLLIDEKELGEEFFNLRTGFAGELMEKMVNYGQKMVVIVSDPNAYGERFAELHREHEAHPFIRFMDSKSAAREWLDEN